MSASRVLASSAAGLLFGAAANIGTGRYEAAAIIACIAAGLLALALARRL